MLSFAVSASTVFLSLRVGGPKALFSLAVLLMGPRHGMRAQTGRGARGGGQGTHTLRAMSSRRREPPPRGSSPLPGGVVLSPRVIEQFVITDSCHCDRLGTDISLSISRGRSHCIWAKTAVTVTQRLFGYFCFTENKLSKDNTGSCLTVFTEYCCLVTNMGCAQPRLSWSVLSAECAVLSF